ncbi:ComEC/Rec2 family competence protein [Nesterenkonia alba]|uniref:ComEC/Rec2 family competence protein n=1 Tax=Nesterenkonia alba TaxID=515814 RepID=UPI00146CD11C|nr:ComEC/Rec2 family competence protein [Nesterenkonia alba]
MPAALSAWAIALVCVHATASYAVRLSAAATVVSLLALGAGVLLRRHRRAALVAAHLCLAAVCSAGVAHSAYLSLQTVESTGWAAAVEDPGRLEVQLRVTEDAQPLREPGWGGQQRVRATATVHRFRPAGEQEWIPVRGAYAVVIAQVPHGVHPDWLLTAGVRYSGEVRASPTDPGERASALLFPATEPLAELPADAWTDLMGVFGHLRETTSRAAASTVADAPALLPGVILGDRSGQDEELTEAMRVSGLSHMTVVSGTHCALVMGALMGVLRICRTPRWCTPVAVLLGLVLFVLLVQPAPSVIRAAVMGGIGAVAVFAGRGRVSSSLLMVCVLVLLVYDPWYCVEPAFQLSVAATAGIVLVGRRLKEIFDPWMPAIVSGPLALATASQIFVTPVLLPIAGGVNTYSVVANILAGPLLLLVTVPGTVAALLSVVAPGVTHLLLNVAAVPAAVIGVIGRSVAGLPQSLAEWPPGWLGWVLVVVYLAGSVVMSRLLIEARRPGQWELVLLTVCAGSFAAVVIPGPTG